jgi:glycosyltransferase involved in cell wall biosynthesis
MDELIKQYSLSSVLVLPSEYEAFGLVLVEAMTQGIPVIASNVGGIPFVLENGKSGVLFEYGNENEMKKMMKIVLTNNDFRAQLIKNGRIRANDFHPNKIIYLLDNLYKNVLLLE